MASPEERDKHAKKYPPSAAGRWMNCTASPMLIAELMEGMRIVERPAGEAAQNGTAMHSGAEFALDDGVEDVVEALTGFTCPDTGIVLDAQMASIVDEYVQLIRAKRDRDDGHLYIEKVVSLTDECYGTADAVIVSPRRLRTWDLKTGSGHIVYAKDNWQLGIYGAAALLELEDFYDFDTIELGISQPPLGHESRVIHSPSSLHDIAYQVTATIDLIEDGKGSFAPSDDNCRWCPASPLCPALVKNKVAIAVSDFEDVFSEPFEDFTEEDPISDMDWGRRLTLVGLLRLWCDEVESTARHMLIEGKTPDGDSLIDKFKVVRGRSGNRRFKDAVKAVQSIARKFGLKKKDTHTEPVPRSPSAIEKLIAGTEAGTEMKKKDIKALVDDYCERAPGGPTVVPASDEREPFDRTEGAQQDFADVVREDPDE